MKFWINNVPLPPADPKAIFFSNIPLQIIEICTAGQSTFDNPFLFFFYVIPYQGLTTVFLRSFHPQLQCPINLMPRIKCDVMHLHLSPFLYLSLFFFLSQNLLILMKPYEFCMSPNVKFSLHFLKVFLIPKESNF